MKIIEIIDDIPITNDIEYMKSLIEKYSKMNITLIVMFTTKRHPRNNNYEECTKKHREHISKSPDKFKFETIYIDEKVNENEIYKLFSNKHIMFKIPTLMTWYPNEERDENMWHNFDEMQNCINMKNCDEFFTKCCKIND